MSEVARPFYRAFFLTAFPAPPVFTVGFGGKKEARTPPSAPPPPAAQPTEPLKANPTTINKGDASTLSWSSTNATQLTISPEVGAVAPEGSTKVAPSDSTTYTITASGPGGSADSTVRVTVSAPAAPPPPTNATMD